MATKSVGTIRALMEMASRKYVSDTAKGEKANNRFNKGAKRGFRSSNKAAGLFTSGMKRMLGAVVAVAGTKALGALVKNSLNAADAIAKTADKVGFSTDALQELRFAAKQSGVEFVATDVALQRFSRRVGEAANGAGVLAKTFKENNIALKNQNGTMRSSSDILDDYADLIGRTDDQQQKLLLTFQAFDTEGAALVNLLGEGSGEMKKLRQEARDLGIVLDEDLLRGAEGANDALDKMSSTLSAELNKKILELAPTIEALATKFIDSLPAILDFIEEVGKAIDLIDDTDPVEEATKALGGFALEIANTATALDEANASLKALQQEQKDDPFFEDWQEQLPTKEMEELSEQIAILEGKLEKAKNALAEARQKLIEYKEEADKAKAANDGLVESVDDGTVAVGKNTQAWIEQQKQMAIMANKAFPDISDAIDETAKRMDNLREKLGLDPFEDAVKGAEEFAKILGAVNDIASALASGAVERIREEEREEIQFAEDRQVRRGEEAEARALADTEQALATIQDADQLAARLVEIEDAKNLALSNSELKFKNDSIVISKKAADEEAAVRRAQKPFLIAEAIANTAVAVTKNLANPALAILTAAAGAIQVANIVATKFATGGSGIVRGPGGTDKTFVPIMASKDERITIQTTAQQRAGIFPGSGVMGGGGNKFTLEMHNHFEGIADEDYVMGTVNPILEKSVRDGFSQLMGLSDIADGSNLGGDLLRQGKGR